MGAGSGQLTFTSGATEGIHSALLSALCALRERRAAGLPCGDLLLYGATEHKAVPESLAHWNRLLGAGCELRALPVDAGGRHRLDVLRQLAPRAALVCTMAANNETGVVSDLAAIEAILDETGSAAWWMVDCVQALGKLPLNLAATRIDYAPFSGHKLYAPKGIGMLYVRDRAPYTPLMTGGGQEGDLRSGTENMAGIAALGAVLAALEEGSTFRSHAQMSAYRDHLAAALRRAFPGIVFNAPFGHALPTTLNFSVAGLTSGDMLDLFDAAAVRVSAGSACSAAQAAPSHVLAAMQLPAWRAASAVRLSFGPLADDALIDAACSRIARCGEALRSSAPAPSVPAPDCAAGGVNSDRPLALASDDMDLDRQAVDRLLDEYPEALLIDVREAREFAASISPLDGRVTHNVPLSRLAEHLAGWLRDQPPRPLVFLCRSGNRSAKAAHCLRQLGYPNAWHLAGGLALA